jgi:hypothetical protein
MIFYSMERFYCIYSNVLELTPSSFKSKFLEVSVNITATFLYTILDKLQHLNDMQCQNVKFLSNFSPPHTKRKLLDSGFNIRHNITPW